MRGHFIYLPPILSHSTPQTAHSAVVRLSFPVQENHSLFFFSFLTISPQRRVISTHLRMISRDSAHMLCIYLTSPNHRLSLPLFFLFLWLSYSSFSLSLPACVIIPLKEPLFLLSACLTCRSQEDSSLSFIWLNYYAGFAQGKGMSDTSLSGQSPFPSAPSTVCLPDFPSLKADLLPSSIPLFLPNHPPQSQCGC